MDIVSLSSCQFVPVSHCFFVAKKKKKKIHCNTQSIFSLKGQTIQI